MKKLTLIIFAFLLFVDCSKENLDNEIEVESINGVVQKGPFINGTSIMVRELSNKLVQTGKNFGTQISNNLGSFEIQNIKLKSNYIEIEADGFYYDEVLGETSNSRITLLALSDVLDQSTINVNMLSHLEKGRVAYLVSQGTEFKDAKLIAQKEVLNIFGFELPNIKYSEKLDISKNGDDNAILLAASVILQGYRTESELTELLSNLSNDLREDGVLTNPNLGSELINHALYLDTNSIRNNLEKRYKDLGVNAVIPDFEKYVQIFLDSTKFKITESLIEYPEEGLYGDNILNDLKSEYASNYVSLRADLKRGANLKVKITKLEGDNWGYKLATSINWHASFFDWVKNTQTYTNISSGESCDLCLSFDTGVYLIEYFENYAEKPTKTKTISTQLVLQQ